MTNIYNSFQELTQLLTARQFLSVYSLPLLFHLPFVQSADSWVPLTFGLCNDVTHSQPLAHTVECLVPRIAPLINIIIGARPDHVIHCIITST